MLPHVSRGLEPCFASHPRRSPGTLYEKCRATAGQGKIERIERIGGSVVPGNKAAFESTDEITYATSFITNGRILMPDRWETRNAGSSMECEMSSGASPDDVVYERTLPSLWQPMLADGARDDMKRSELPIFDTMRINGSGMSAQGGGPFLIGAVPVPNSGGQPVQIALAFSLTTMPAAAPEPGRPKIQLEILVLRGPARAPQDYRSAQIKSLLSRPGSIVTDIAMCNVSGMRSMVESVTEWIHPLSAGRKDSILVPEQFSRLNQGTTLELESGTKDEGTYPVRFILNHDLRKPQLPATDGHAHALISPEKAVSYRISVNETLNMAPGVWMAVKEVPLAPILGDLDPAAKKDSCYVYGRVLYA